MNGQYKQSNSIFNFQDSTRHCSETDISTLSPSTNLYTYHSEYNLTLENEIKKSVNFSENISKHLISPCNPTITFNDNLRSTLNERLTKKRYGEMRRCQSKLFEKGHHICLIQKKLNPNKIMIIYIAIAYSYHIYILIRYDKSFLFSFLLADIIVVDPVLHLHSFTDSPPNEFCLQPDEDEEDILMEKSHINIIPNLDGPVSLVTVNSPIKDNQTLNSMNTSILDSLLERISDIIKRLFDIKRSNKVKRKKLTF